MINFELARQAESDLCRHRLSAGLFIMKGDAVGIPLEMDEAAMMDGCRPSQTFSQRSFFPLMKNTVATVVISDVFWIWNEFQIALILLNASEPADTAACHQPMFGAYSTKWDIALPGLIISVVPIIVVFLHHASKTYHRRNDKRRC